MTLKAGLWKLRLPRSPWACGTAGPGMGRLRLAGLGWAGCPGYPSPASPSPLGPETRPSRPARPPARRSSLPARPRRRGALSPRRDPCWPATPRTHRPSSHSTGFVLQLRPQHPTLPAPPLTHFPAEPAPSITPAPPPPPPPKAGPRQAWAVGSCGNCRKTGGKAARGGGEHAWCRAGRCGQCSSFRRRRATQSGGPD